MTTLENMNVIDTTMQLEMRGGGAMAVYRVCKVERPLATLILLQEIFGINATMRAQAQVFAQAGFDVLVPDLFWRQEAGVQLDPENPEDRVRATALMKGMDETLAVQDALEAALLIRERSGGAKAVAAVGYCLGGKLAYLLATRKEVDMAVSYYGVGIHAALDRAKDIRCPLLVHLAEDDSLCLPAAQDAIKLAMSENPLITVQGHANVGHAFARLGSPGFALEAAQRADHTTDEFLQQALKRLGTC